MVQRTNAMLTDTDREYLREETVYETRQAEHHRIKSIEEGITQSLSDFQLLVDTAVLDISELLEFDSEEDAVDQLASLVTFVDHIAYEFGIPTGEIIQEGRVDERTGELDEVACRLLTGHEPHPENLVSIVRFLASQPETFAEIFSEQSQLISSVRDEQELTTAEISDLTNQLAQREISELWEPLLEAGRFSYDEDTLEYLQKQTRHARQRATLKDEIGDQLEQVSQQREPSRASDLEVRLNTDKN